jgi:hypothetical protein
MSIDETIHCPDPLLRFAIGNQGLECAFYPTPVIASRSIYLIGKRVFFRSSCSKRPEMIIKR